MLNLMLKLRKNQMGSTFVLVLVCMTFVGFLTVSMLFASAANIQMKTVDTKSKENFYTTETAMDELKVGLEEEAQKIMKETYTYVLNSYSQTPESQRDTLMKNRFVNSFYNKFASDSGTNESSLLSSIDLEDYLITSKGVYDAEVVSSDAIRINRNLSNNTVTFKNVSVKYTDNANYSSTITTDMIFYPEFSTINRGLINDRNLDFINYVLIADDTITNNSSSTAEIDGNVYGGNAIVAHRYNSALQFTSDLIISRGTLKSLDQGVIKVLPKTSGSALLNEVWVKDIETASSSGAGSTKDATITVTGIDINANSNVEDDLTLNANKINVTLKGSYMGYSAYNGDPSSPEGSQTSSCISINARNSILNMSGLDQLWLAGTNFIEVPDIYGNSTSGNYSSVMNGESITFRGSQALYMVPGNLIEGARHNPMTEAEYLAVSGCALSASNIAQYSTLYHLNPTRPTRNIVVKYSTPTGTYSMVYVYWNFASPDAASDYFYSYYHDTNNHGVRERLQGLFNDMQVGNVIYCDDSSTLNVGNLLRIVSPTEIDYSSRKDMLGNQASYNTAEVRQKEQNLTVQYQSLINSLSKNRYSSVILPSLANRFVQFEDEVIAGNTIKGLKSLAEEQDSTGHMYIDTVDSDGNTIKVKGTPAVVPGSTETGLVLDGGDRKGVIVAACDVILNGGTFEGMILTTGNIFLKSGAKVKSNPTLVEDTIKGNELLRNLFRFTQGTNTYDGFDYNLVKIRYENWYKKE